jgi:hypothetical protein
MTFSRTLVTSLSVGALAAATLAFAAPAAQAAAPAGRIIIGDSVTGMNTAALRSRGFTVNYTVSRQFSELPGIMRSYGSRLPRNVVVHLGTNGTISLSTCQQAVKQAGSKRTVFFVTVRVPRSWEASNNATLRSCDRAFKGKRVRIIDWHKRSDRNSSWFYSDGYHPTEGVGAVQYANLIDRAVDRFGR